MSLSNVAEALHRLHGINWNCHSPYQMEKVILRRTCRASSTCQ